MNEYKNKKELVKLTPFSVIPLRFERKTHALEVEVGKNILSNENHYITYCIKFTLSKFCHNMYDSQGLICY
jgi:hypothetical protein